MTAGLILGALSACAPTIVTQPRDSGGGVDSGMDTGADSRDSADTADTGAETGLSNCDETSPWTDVTAGALVTCGVHADGCAECWGAPSQDSGSWDTGGDWGTSGYAKHVPAGPWAHVELARFANDWTNSFACGLRPDGDVECWSGAGPYFWPGPWTSPTIVAGDTVCAIDEAGGAVCQNPLYPGEPPPPSPLAQLEALPNGFFAIDGGGALWWDMRLGWSGVEATQYYGGSDDVFIDAAGDGDAICAVDAAGVLTCEEEAFTTRTEVSSPPEGSFVDVCMFQGWTGDFDTACAVRTDGAVVCWGKNTSIAPFDERFTVLSCGYAHACGVTDDQRLLCWGDCASGECDPPS